MLKLIYCMFAKQIEDDMRVESLMMLIRMSWMLTTLKISNRRTPNLAFYHDVVVVVVIEEHHAELMELRDPSIAPS